jgi:glycosyltransferase involved in cell wall biosynthesis
MIDAKAHEVLLRAVAAVRNRTGKSIRLVLAGDGPIRSDLEALATSLGIRDIVDFPGLLERYQVHQLMDVSDIYAMPSRSEGFSMASLEAMGIGTACVFSDIGPFVQPFQGNAVFHELDDSDHLADQIVSLVEDPSLREDYARQARNHVVENYPISKTARLFRELYDELLNET